MLSDGEGTTESETHVRFMQVEAHTIKKYIKAMIASRCHTEYYAESV